MTMKLKNIIYGLATTLAFVACDDLNTVPESSTVVDSQRDEMNLESQTRGILQEMVSAVQLTGDHTDYGIPGMNMRLESDGMDMVAEATGYNQYGSSLYYTDRIYTSSATRLIWQLNYKIIHAANLVIGKIPADTKDDEMKFFRGNALALRAYAYFNLAQVYQFTYADTKSVRDAAGNIIVPSKPCVPVVDENSTIDESCNNPRASVDSVYNFISKDLDEAILLLGNSSYPVSDKMFVNEDVAHGLRARVRLVMQDYNGALEDARLLTAQYSPLTREEAGKPSFYTLEDHNWIWGLAYNDESYAVQTGIVNWPSHLCSFVSNGYTTLGGVYRCINENLFNMISPTDVRSGWWLDSNKESVNLENTAYGRFVASSGMPAYTNVKFAAADNDINSLLNSQDYPLMRVEEMILIEAECLAKQGDADAYDVLNDFVKKNRDVYYDCSSIALDDLADEIWFQRRIELWGEGFAFQDIMRLNKDVDRRNSNFGADFQWVIPAHSDILLYRIPQSEIEANHAISNEDNNPAGELPTV